VARLNLLPLYLGLALAAVGTTFLQGSWPLRNQANFIAGDGPWDAMEFAGVDGWGAAPGWPVGRSWSVWAQSPPAEMPRARALWPPSLAEADDEPLALVRARRVAEYLDRHPQDAPAHAHLVRYALHSSPLPMRKGQVEVREMRPEWEMALASCRAGAQLEPDNAFFPLLESVILMGTGREPEALEALARAARCESYREYALDEADTLIAAVTQMRGYQGGFLTIALDASVVFPHVTAIRTLGNAVAEIEGTRGEQARRDMLRVSNLVVRGSDAVIGVLVGALAGVAQFSEETVVRDWTALRPVARAFDAELGEPLATPIVEAGIGWREWRISRPLPDSELNLGESLHYLFWSALALLGLAVLTLFGTAMAVSGPRPPRRAVPLRGVAQALLLAWAAAAGAFVVGYAVRVAFGGGVFDGSLELALLATIVAAAATIGLRLLGGIGWNTFGFVLALAALAYAATTAQSVREDRLWGDARQALRGEADDLRRVIGIAPNAAAPTSESAVQP
jgi:hypothetical protein